MCAEPLQRYIRFYRYDVVFEFGFLLGVLLCGEFKEAISFGSKNEKLFSLLVLFVCLSSRGCNDP